MRRKGTWWVGAATWFAAWHLFLFSHVWTSPAYFVPGPIGDNTVMLWNLGWVQYALNHKSPGFWMHKAFYPDGFLFLYGTHTWLDGFLGWLASPLLPEGRRGIVLWANLVQWFASIATGVFAMAALRHWGVRRWQLQLLGASVLTFSAFRIFASTGHYHFFGTQWMMAALFAASVTRRLLRAGWLRSAIAWSAAGGLLTGVAFLNDQTHAVFAALLITAILGSLLFTRIRTSRGAVVSSILVAGLAAIVVGLVHLVPIVMAIHAGKFQYRVPLQFERIVDLSSIFLPPDRHPLLGSWVQEIRQRAGLIVEEGPYIGLAGYLFLVVGGIGCLLSIRRSSRALRNPWRRVFWATLLGGLFLVFAMGEHLQVGQQRYVVLPGKLLREIPVLNNIRLMQRWIWPSLLCLTVAGTVGMSLWFRGGQMSGRTTRGVVALAALASLEGKQVPAPPPTDIIRGDYLNPPGLVDGILRHYKGGGVLMMPLEHSFSQANAIQFNTNFLINVTAAYTARSPWDPTLPPWDGPAWSPAAEAWLRKKQVKMVVFPIEYSQSERNIPAWMPWIRGALNAFPELVILDRNGKQITN